jgi:hypothetical protein
MGPVERFREGDGQGRELVVCDRDDGKAAVRIEEPRVPAGRVCVSWVADPLLAPDLCRAICEAAGTLPPVMLGRPDLAAVLDADGFASFRGLSARRSADGGVTFSVAGNSETLSAPQVRHLAAIAVALADEPEPTLAEVDELESVLREATGRHDPDDTMTGIALAVLRAGWKREATDGGS